VKTTAIAICLLLVVSSAHAESFMIESLAEQESSRHVEIAVLGGGMSVARRIDVYRYKTGEVIFPGAETELKPRLSLTSYADGRVRPLKLSAGHYDEVAKAENDLRADRYRNVHSDSAKRKSTFSMHLILRCIMFSPTPARWSPAAEEMPVQDPVQALSGTVYDQTGAAVAGTSIKVIRNGTGGKQRIAELKADAEGRFAAQLPEGVYIAFFFSPGCKNAIVPFEVTKEAAGDLRVTLLVGSTT
jgi:hypothetical protein